MKVDDEALLRGVDEIRKQYEREIATMPLFDRQRRIDCRDQILKALPGLINALEDRAGAMDADDALMNLHMSLPLITVLYALRDHHASFEPWPEYAYGPHFDWDGPTPDSATRLATQYRDSAVYGLVWLLRDSGVKVTSYDSNPGFIRLQELTGRVLKQPLETELLRRLVRRCRPAGSGKSTP